MGFFLFGGVILYGSVVLVLILCLVSIARAIRAPAGTLRGAGCGGCGYPVGATVAERCSECGAALVKVGIVTPSQLVRHRGSYLQAALGWTILVLALGGITWTVFQQMALMGGAGGGGMNQRMQYFASTDYYAGSFMNSDGRWVEPADNITVGYTHDLIGKPATPAESGTINLRVFVPDKGSADLVLEVPDGRCTITRISDLEVVYDGPYESAVIQIMLETVGLDTESEQVEVWAEDLENILSLPLQDPSQTYGSGIQPGAMDRGGLQSSGSSMSSNFAPATPKARTGQLALVVGIVGLYIGGLAAIAALRARAVRSARSAQFSASSSK